MSLSEVPADCDLESLLRSHLPGSIQLLSMLMMGRRSPLPGPLRFFRPTGDHDSAVVLAEMEDEVEDVNTAVFCPDEPKQIEMVS